MHNFRYWLRLTEASRTKFNAAFRRWFAASKIVDAAGRPLPVYHGTDRVFDQFGTDHIGSRTDHGLFGPGFYFVNDTEWASSYAEFEATGYPNVHACYLRMVNPYIYRNDIPDGTWQDTPGSRRQRAVDFAARVRAAGHDGIIVPGGYQGDKRINEYVVFEPEQIRSVWSVA